MKHNVGDKVRIKSKEWWDKQPKDESGYVDCGADTFTDIMTVLCGKVVEISDICGDVYSIKDFGLNWTDEMFEDEVIDAATSVLVDIAKAIREHNLGVSVKEEDGKLIIEPLKVEEDLPIDTPVIVATKEGVCMGDWNLRYYAGGYTCFIMGCNSKSESSKNREWDYIIPFDKFDPNNIEESLKHNIVKP